MAARRRVVEVLSECLSRVRDTCEVYVLRSGRDGVAVDFGSGVVLEHLSDLGIDRITDVLVTHHHRDQVWGLERAYSQGARIWVPPVEQDLLRHADRHWRARQFDLDYTVRDDRNIPLHSAPVTGVVAEYRTVRFGSYDITTIPTPGHTTGSVTFLTEVDGRRVAFSGDLIAAPGKLWSLASTQWGYNGIEGVAATWNSALDLRDRRPEWLLPSHGDPIVDPAPAINLLTSRLMGLIEDRGMECLDLADLRADPYDVITPHLLQNRTSVSRSYALVSDSGKALLFDFGYDFCTGVIPPGDRASRRPLLATLAALRSQHGVDRIDVVIPTHYHDDHVAGFNLLREVEGTRVWAAANFAEVLRTPRRFDLPCLWFDPIPVDRVVPLGTPFRWEEYELCMYALPGHTLYACAIAFEVDGYRVVVSGDQQGTVPGVEPEFLNYTYKNRFDHRDFVGSAQLYRRLAPDLLVSGHWDPRWVDTPYLDRLLTQGRRLAENHELLLPLEAFNLGAEGAAAWMRPYRHTVAPGERYQLEVEVRNPFGREQIALVELELPAGWRAEPVGASIGLEAHGTGTVKFAVAVDGRPVQGERVACRIKVGDVDLGLAAESLVTVSDGAGDGPLPVATDWIG